MKKTKENIQRKVIIIVVLVLLLGGLYLYRNFHPNERLQSNNEQTNYNKLDEDTWSTYVSPDADIKFEYPSYLTLISRKESRHPSLITYTEIRRKNNVSEYTFTSFDMKNKTLEKWIDEEQGSSLPEDMKGMIKEQAKWGTVYKYEYYMPGPISTFYIFSYKDRAYVLQDSLSIGNESSLTTKRILDTIEFQIL